jgi:hypothetical protein
MNILMYVMTMLMLLASLTYVKLEGFRSFNGVEASFNHYMKVTERESINNIAEQSYDATVLSGKDPKENNKPNPSSSRLSFNLLVNKAEREKNAEAYQQTRALFIELMTNMFKDQEFFIEISEKRPSFLNDLMDEIPRLAEAADHKVTQTDDLSKLEFSDLELSSVFSLMLRGIPQTEKAVAKENKEENSDDSKDSQEVAPIADVEKAEEEALATESNEPVAPVGKESLLDYITLKKSTKIRVYLAARPLLLAIYGNESIVDSIIEKRQALFKQMRSGANKDDVSKAFKGAFENTGTASNYGAILDFEVTNVNPKNYNRKKR